MKTKVKIFCENDSVKIPSYAHESDAGFDLYAISFDTQDGTRINPDAIVYLPPHHRLFAHTGIHLGIPEGCYVSINPRSGLACKKGLTVANAPGIIDSNYKGEIIVCLLNTSDTVIEIAPGSRVAQAILHEYLTADFEVAFTMDELGKSDRGIGGFGSTGVN